MVGSCRLSCLSPRSRFLAAAVPLLLSAVLTLAPARRAAAQGANPHIAISEVVVQLDGTDRTRTYFEFQNLGSAPFDFRNAWIYRKVVPTDSGTAGSGELMIQIAGTGGTDAADASKLQPIPVGGVLLVEWKRPNAGGSGGTGTPAGPNVFVTGANSEIGDQDLQNQIAIALFAPQTAAPPLPSADANFGTATMLAYWFTGNLSANDGTNPDSGGNWGMKRAAQLGLWQLGDSAPSAYDFATTLRQPAVAPGQPFPAIIGRRASDYYLAHYGVADLSNASRSSDTFTIGRYGSPGQPNLQFAGAELIPGQTLPNGYSLLPILASGTTATTAAGSPAAATQVGAVTAAGIITANILNATTWSGWQYLGGPSVVKPVIVDNAKTASRSLFAVDAFTNQLYVNRFVAVGSNPAAFQGFQAIGGIVSNRPAAAVDATSGNEAVVFNDASGVTMVALATSGAFAAAKPLPSNAKLADTTIVSTPSGFVVLGFNATQLQMSLLAADGTPSALSNVGAVIANRSAITPVARFNPVAGQIEILEAGAAGALQLVHLKLGATRAGDTVSAAINTGLTTDTQPALAVNTDNGDLMVLARGSDTPIPSGEKYAAQAGQARSAILRNAGTAFLASTRIATGLIPAGIGPDVFYNANTKQFVQLLVGEDFQLYRNVVAA